ncbi:MAG: hypothetical protein JWQ41_934 [Variovorax sp.]|nr:hypothetical protein [Variovorax sp.]
MTVKYVVSIAGELLYFDADRQPAEPFPAKADSGESKPDLKLIPPAQHPAADDAWDEALNTYSSDQRNAAEISEVL